MSLVADRHSTPVYTHLGYEVASTILAVAATILGAIPFLLYYFGKEILSFLSFQY